jgi:hypothetical protein
MQSLRGPVQKLRGGQIQHSANIRTNPTMKFDSRKYAQHMQLRKTRQESQWLLLIKNLLNLGRIIRIACKSDHVCTWGLQIFI